MMKIKTLKCSVFSVSCRFTAILALIINIPQGYAYDIPLIYHEVNFAFPVNITHTIPGLVQVEEYFRKKILMEKNQ